MSSEIVRIAELHCDGEGCDAVFKGAQASQIVARATAQALDWFCKRGKDYCPECAEGPQMISDFADGLHGTVTQNRDMLAVCLEYMGGYAMEHFANKDDFIGAVEAELAERAKVSKEQ